MLERFRLTLHGCSFIQSTNSALSGSPGVCEKLGTHHSLREQSAGPMVIKLALPGVNLVPSVLKGADSGAEIAKWSCETGKSRCQPRGQGLGPLPAAGETPALEEGVDCPSCSRRGRKLGRRGRRGSPSNRIPRNALGPDMPPARGCRPFLASPLGPAT